MARRDWGGLRRAGVRLSALPLLILSVVLAHAQVCRDLDDTGAAYTICTVEAGAGDLRLYLNDRTGNPYATFAQLAGALARSNETLVFAMNAGMFEENLSPVGLYIEDGKAKHAVNTRDGPGNFHMKPNGVFYFGPHGAGIMETQAYLAAHPHPAFATQSGPMLVIHGAIHPMLQPDGTSQKIRNGVGVRGRTIVFAISREPVSFYRFASLFRDTLDCPDALFLDGTISSLYAPALGRTLQLLPVGPMIGLTVKRAP